MTVTSKLRPKRRYAVLAALWAIGLYVIVPQIGDFNSSLGLLRNPEPTWTFVAIGFTLLTYLAAAGTYFLLAFKPLRYWHVTLVQLAAMFINRLLPGGIGALGANYAYLRRAHHSAAQAGSVVAINNILGGLGHVIVVVTTFALFNKQMAAWPDGNFEIGTMVKVTALILTVLLIAVIAIGRERVANAAKDVRTQLLSYRARPQRLFGALVTSILLTLSNVLCLSFCAQAVGVHMPFVVLLLVFSFGVGAGTATPTPGGLGGFEAGLVAGFIAYGIPGPAALALALLYRLVSYWLPLVLGAVAFIFAQRQKLFVS